MTRSLSALATMLSLALAASVLSPPVTPLESSGIATEGTSDQAPAHSDVYLTTGAPACVAVIPPWLDRPASRRGSSDLSPSYAAVISPTLTWNTFLGTDTTVQAHAVAIDGSGNVYITGRSDGAWGAPVNPYAGNTDAFVAKFNGSGHLVWNTFLGSPTGDDWAYGIAVDGNGNARLAGYSTEGWGLSPVNNYAGGEDAFVARLDTNGNRLWHTFAGGSGNDRGYGIALDGSGNAYVTGYSGSGTGWSGTPVNGHAGSDDAFAIKLNASGSRQWYTFMGSSSGDYGQAIAVDATANAHVTGYSNADWGSPLVHWVAGKDAFVARLNANGGRVWNTFLGGNGNEQGNGIALGGSGAVHIAGDCTMNWGSTPRNGFSGGSDLLAARLDGAGQLQWHTFLGSTNNEYGYGIAVDGAGNSYLTGYGKASWGPPVSSFPFLALEDIIFAKVDANGNLRWNTFLGSTSNEQGRGLAVDGAVNAYVAGYGSLTWGTPISSFAGIPDAAAVAKLYAGPIEPVSVTIAGPTTGWINTSYAFTATVGPSAASPPITYTWSATQKSPVTHVDGSTDGIDVITYSWPQIGTKTVSISATNLGGTVTATRLITLTDVPITGLVARNSSPTAPGRSTILSATVATGTNIGYAWALGDGQAGSGQTVTHTYPAPGNYRAVVTASNPVSSLTATTYVTVANSDVFLPAVVKGYACSPDAYEPNDTAEEAYVLSGNTTLSGNFCGADFKDEFKFRIDTTAVTVTVNLTQIPAGCDYDLYLYRLPDATNPVAESSASGNASESIYEPTQAGDYLVYVYAAVKGESAGTSPYQLSVTFE